MKKILIAVSAAVVFVFVAAIVVLIWFLPNPSSVARSLPLQDKPSAPIQKLQKGKQQPAQYTPELIKADVPQDVTPPVPEQRPQETVQNQNDQNIEDFMDEEKPLVSVCDNAIKASDSKYAHAKTQKDFFQMMSDAFGKKEKDPYVESITPAFRFLFRTPEVKEFLKIAEEAKKSGDVKFQEKAEFYWMLTRAVKAVHEALPNMESIGDRSYQLYVLLNVLSKKPEMWEDPSVQNYCYAIEDSLKNVQAVDQKTESLELEKLISAANLKPEEVGYRPNFKTKFTFDYDQNSFTLGSSWLENFSQN